MLKTTQTLDLAKQVLEIEAQAILNLCTYLDETFIHAVQSLLDCQGRVIVSGIGKSGHIARKIAATFASTGTPAYFVHPAEASHGDLGMITKQDIVIAISYSGESDELLSILPIIKRLGTQMIAMTGNPHSNLAKLADTHLNIHIQKEACPLNLAPTASTTATLAMGDALAVAVLNTRNFSPQDFARSHPGGALGRKLLTYVKDVMRQGDHLPYVIETASISDALFQITAKHMGMTAIVNQAHQVIGIFTDGDLRRVLNQAQHIDFKTQKVIQVMTHSPRTISADHLAIEAVSLMEKHQINQLLVVDEKQKLIGALNMHDLFAKKVI